MRTRPLFFPALAVFLLGIFGVPMAHADAPSLPVLSIASPPREDRPIIASPANEPEHGAAPLDKRGKKRSHAVFSGRLASASELRDEPLDRPSGRIELFAVNFRESVDINLYKADGSFDEEELDKLNHIFRCKRTTTEKSIDPHLFEMVSRVFDHFGKRIELVSGFRNQERTSSFHFHGSASDIRIAGVTEKVLYKFVTSLDTGGMGLGIYPRAGFIHIDIRPEPSFRWVDYSPPGTSDMGRPHGKGHRKGARGAEPNS